MSLIPSNNTKIGDEIILKHSHSSCAGTFTRGTKVRIIDIGERGYDIADDEGHKMYECGWDL